MRIPPLPSFFHSTTSTSLMPQILPNIHHHYYLSPRFTPTRLFGSKLPPTPNSPYTPAPIQIFIDLPESSSTSSPPFSLTKQYLDTQLSRIRNLIGYPTYDLNLQIVDSQTMRTINRDTRGIDSDTDILSFPANMATSPGVLEEIEIDMPDFYCLGDLILCWDNVVEKTREDLEGEWEEERGVSGIIANMKQPEERVVPLLIHGVLHLVGYDHIEDEDWEVMVEREEEIWRELNKRMGKIIDDEN